MNITFYLFNCHPTQIFFWQINQGGRLVHDSLNIMLSTRKAGVDRWRQDFQMLWQQLSLQQPGNDRSLLEVDSRFPVPRFTEGSEAAKPHAFGVGLTAATFLPTPNPPASVLPRLPVHPPTTAPALLPPQASVFLPNPATRCSQANEVPKLVGLGYAAAWALLHVMPHFWFWVMWPWRPAYWKERGFL